MSIKFFKRNEVLDEQRLDYHADTIQMIDKIRYAPDKNPKTEYELSQWKELYNYLNAIYDGVLYSELEDAWYIDDSPFYTISGFNNQERGEEIALRIYAIIGIINCCDTYSEPMTENQAMIAAATRR